MTIRLLRLILCHLINSYSKLLANALIACGLTAAFFRIRVTSLTNELSINHDCNQSRWW